ncbi:hypothetical protein AVEN_214657-1 [Araneus ventricosus]|uniref:Uncharacterized protein n=1 Tax=Araneus ventricosus TaxID=182803 RepID=A0A4Y2NYL7_ARAVE|nr:hypothetical protein AVEN_214657-1 [Araneus ventricosus]
MPRISRLKHVRLGVFGTLPTARILTSDFISLVEKSSAESPFQPTEDQKPSLNGTAAWTMISSMPVSIDWFNIVKNASTTLASMWKSNMYQCLSIFAYFFDFVNEHFLSENSLHFEPPT